MSETAAPVAAGNEIAPGYAVIEHLRRGNDLDVYDAWSEERSTRCIVKAIRPDRLDKPRHSLAAEGELLLELSHPHIVRAYETIAEPLPLVVMETLTGATLGHMIAEGPPASTANVAHLGLQLGSAIRYLHNHGVLHLDLKPSNVIARRGSCRNRHLALPGARAGAGRSPHKRRGHLGPGCGPVCDRERRSAVRRRSRRPGLAGQRKLGFAGQRKPHVQ